VRYSDFVLRIEPPGEEGCPVLVESPMGEGHGIFQIPLAASELQPEVVFDPGASWRDTRRSADRGRLTPRDIGERLFAALFSGTVGKLFERSAMALENAPNRGLRIRILIDPEISAPALHSLPWEFLYWTEQRRFLALSRKSPIVRSLSLPLPLRSLRVNPPLRILVVIADSTGLDLEREKLALQEACGAIPDIEIVPLEATKEEEIRRFLQNSPAFHVLHYMGHGDFDSATGEGSLRLARGQDGTPGSTLAQIVRETPSLRLAVLNGCHTARYSNQKGLDPFDGVAPATLLAGLPAVVATQYQVSDRAAIAFSRAFYTRLAAGDSIEEAVSDGRQIIHAAAPRSPEWATPVLFLRGKNGRLFIPRKPGGRDPDLLRSYLRWLVVEFGKLAPPGAPRQGRSPSVLLNSVFVPLQCRRFDPLAPDGTLQPPSPPGLEGAVKLPGALEPFGCERRIVLLGDAGSGKTTLFRWLALQHAWAKLKKETRLRLAAQRIDPSSWEIADREIDAGLSRVPILVRLADFAAARRQAPSLSLTAFLGHHLGPGLTDIHESHGAPLALVPLHARLLRALEQEGTLVLLDGLDEIASPGERHDITREIDRFLEDWLPLEPAGPSDRSGGLQVVVSSRLAGYRAAPLGQEVSHWLLEPLDLRAARRFQAVWRRALVPGEESVTMPDPAPPFLDGEALTANPRLATLLAVLPQCAPGGVPRRRIHLYEAAVALELDDLRNRCPLENTTRERLLAALGEWAAGNGNLESALKRFLPEESAERTADALRAAGESGGLLHPALREYLAACWLASDPAQTPLRILERLEDPRWRESLRMALGRLSADLDKVELEETLLSFLATPDPLGDLLPRAAALLAAAIPEMIEVPEKVVEETATRLIAAWADRTRAGGPPALLRFLERTFLRLAGAAPSPALDRALRQALEGDSRDQCLAAAHLAQVAGRYSVEIAEALTSALPRDGEEQGWPVDAALREIAARSPDLLPSRPGTLRLELQRNPGLRRRFQNDPSWRRVGLALYGDSREPERMYRDSAVTPLLLSILEESPGETLASRLWKASADPAEQVRCDALLALTALGEPMNAELRQADPAARRALSHLSRIAGALEISVPAAIGPALTSLEQTAGFLFQGSQGHDLVSALIYVALAFGGSPVQGLALAKAAPAEARPRLLAEVWHCLVAGAHGDPVYNLAVLLDTEGETLVSPPFLLAETLAMAPLSANVRWDRHRAWSLDRLAPHPRDRPEVLSSALDSLAGLAGSFGFVRSWALIVLAPLLREAGLNVEALILALWSLTDSFNARNEAVHALAGSEPAAGGLLGGDPGPVLLAAVRQMEDPFLRLRAFLRLAEAQPDLRDELLPQSAPAEGLRTWLTRRLGLDLPRFVQEILALSDPSQRTRALEGVAGLDSMDRSRWASLAVRSAEKIDDVADRAQALARLASHFPAGRRDRLLARALRQVVRISNESRRAEMLDLLRSRVTMSPPLRKPFERAAAGLQKTRDQARARGLDAPLLLKAERELGDEATPLVLGAIVNDLRRELTLPIDLPSLWAVLMNGERRAAALAALRDHGRAGGLRLTGEAADALDRLIEEGDLGTVTSLQPFLEAAEPASLPMIDRWLEYPDQRLRSFPALLLAERHGMTARTVSGLLDLLADPDDRLRHRAALALHGDFSPGRRPLSSARMGSATLETLARYWLAQRDQAPGIAKIIAWTFERIEHDDARSLELWTGRLAQGKPGGLEAEAILGSIERLHPQAEPAFLRGLRNGSPRAQQAFLRGTCRLLSRNRLRDELWQEIAPCLSQLDPDAGRDSILNDSPFALIEALQEAWESSGKETLRDFPDLADRALARRIHRLSDILCRDPASVREALTQAGLTSRLSGPRIRAAADRIAASPELLAPLLTWLCARLSRDVQDVEPFCPINSDLLALAAATAERLPKELLTAASGLPELQPRLREAARLHDSFPGRRAALLLLAASLRRMTRDALSALRSGFRDVAPVQTASLESLLLYREADGEVLPRLIEGLTDSSPWIAMASGRLLAILARNGGLSLAQRKAALQALATVNSSQRDLYALSAAPPLKIAPAGRLDDILYESLAEASGLIDLLGPEAASKQEGTT
jgi:hypothetical protein